MSFSRRGGARVGAGRPRIRRKPGEGRVAHGRRPALSGREPVHVTVRVRPHVWNLRSWRLFQVICGAFAAGCDRFGFRVIGVGIQGNHLHLLVEAADALALTRGMKGLLVRLARGLNGRMGTRGKAFDERFHAHVLKTPQEVRAAMRYVSGSTAKHAAQTGRALPAGYRDPYTVGYFGERTLLPPGTEGMVVEPRTWLLRYGWRVGTAAGLAAPTVVASSVRVSPARQIGAAANDPPAGDAGHGEHRDRWPAGRRSRTG